MNGKLLLIALLVLAIGLSGCTTQSSPFGIIETPGLGEEGGPQIVTPGTNGGTAVQTETETNGDLIQPLFEDYYLMPEDVEEDGFRVHEGFTKLEEEAFEVYSIQYGEDKNKSVIIWQTFEFLEDQPREKIAKIVAQSFSQMRENYPYGEEIKTKTYGEDSLVLKLDVFQMTSDQIKESSGGFFELNTESELKNSKGYLVIFWKGNVSVTFVFMTLRMNEADALALVDEYATLVVTRVPCDFDDCYQLEKKECDIDADCPDRSLYQQGVCDKTTYECEIEERTCYVQKAEEIQNINDSYSNVKLEEPKVSFESIEIKETELVIEIKNDTKFDLTDDTGSYIQLKIDDGRFQQDDEYISVMGEVPRGETTEFTLSIDQEKTPYNQNFFNVTEIRLSVYYSYPDETMFGIYGGEVVYSGHLSGSTEYMCKPPKFVEPENRFQIG